MNTILTVTWLIVELSVQSIEQPVFGLLNKFESKVTCEQVKAKVLETSPEVKLHCVQVVVPKSA